ISPGIRTDHSAIILHIELQKDSSRGPGLWKFNNSYLQEEDYVNCMNYNLDLWLNDNSILDKRVKWEWIKFKVRDETMKYAKKKCKQRNDTINNLAKHLISLEESLANNPSQQILSEIDLVKNELEDLDSKQILYVIPVQTVLKSTVC
ncbi:unnamed protein product, partial [marine sediment metagenome]